MFSFCILSLRFFVIPLLNSAVDILFVVIIKVWWRAASTPHLIYCQKAPRLEIQRLLFKDGVWASVCETEDQTLTHQIREYLQKSAGSYCNCGPPSSLPYEACKLDAHARGRVCAVFTTSSCQGRFFALLTHHHYIWAGMLPDPAFSEQVLTPSAKCLR